MNFRFKNSFWKKVLVKFILIKFFKMEALESEIKNLNLESKDVGQTEITSVESKVAYIYKITNKINGKLYIGETIQNYKDRWRQHKNFQSQYYTCPILKQAFIKYGIDNFNFEVIQECSFDERFELEKKYIEKYNSIAPYGGYNFLPGGEGGGFLGKTHSDETRKKLSEASRKFYEENPNYYETYREKHIAATKAAGISERVKNSEKYQKALAEGRVGGAGNPPSQETREKIGQSVSKYYNSLNEEEKFLNIEKHRQAMTKAVGKRVGQFELDGVTMIAEFPTASEAERQTNFKRKNIQSNAIGRTKTAYGFIWKYLDEES